MVIGRFAERSVMMAVCLLDLIDLWRGDLWEVLRMREVD